MVGMACLRFWNAEARSESEPGLREQVGEQVDGAAGGVGTEELLKVLSTAPGDLSATREQRLLVCRHCCDQIRWLSDDLRGQLSGVEHREVGPLAGERRHQVRRVAHQRRAGERGPAVRGG